MTGLTSLLDEQKRLFSQHPFFSHLAQSQLEVTTESSVSFFSAMSFFVMSFSDLNKFVLPFENPKSSLEIAINTHCREDANHWAWFIHDLKKLNLDYPMSLVRCLKYLWSDELSASRRLTYELIEMTAGKSAETRLLVVEATEAAGNVAFAEFVAFTRNAEKNLKYFGQLHLDHESGHAMGSDGTLAEQLRLSDDETAAAAQSIEKTFRGFHRFMDQLLAHATLSEQKNKLHQIN